MPQEESLARRPDEALRRLLHALECARSRFAVAIAAETKYTPPARWQSYIEVEDRLRRCLRRLRLHRRMESADAISWLLTLDALQEFPVSRDFEPRRGEAMHLCAHLVGVLARIEEQEADPRVE